MSEFIDYTPEGEPYFSFTSNMGDLEATPYNSAIYVHPYEQRGVDHIFIELEENEDQVRGAFLFRAELELIKPGVFATILEELSENEWQTVICDQVAEGDQAVFDRFVENYVTKVTNKKIKRWLNETQES